MSDDHDHSRVGVAVREAEEGESNLAYVAFNPSTGLLWESNGVGVGGQTREEAVRNAQNLADEQGMIFERPEGWEDVGVL